MKLASLETKVYGLEITVRLAVVWMMGKRVGQQIVQTKVLEQFISILNPRPLNESITRRAGERSTVTQPRWRLAQDDRENHGTSLERHRGSVASIYATDPLAGTAELISPRRPGRALRHPPRGPRPAAWPWPSWRSASRSGRRPSSRRSGP